MLMKYWLSVFKCLLLFVLYDSLSDSGSSARYAAPNEALDMMDDMQELTPS